MAVPKVVVAERIHRAAGIYKSIAERIEANVALWWPARPGPKWDGTPCKLWLGETNGSGYPRMSQRAKSGPRKGKVVKLAVHRVVLKELMGVELRKRVKEGMHLCNEQLCVCETHLEYGTKVANEYYKVQTDEHERRTAPAQREPGED